MKIIRNLLIICVTLCVGYMLCGYAYAYWTQQVSVRGDMNYSVTYHIVGAQANQSPNVNTATEPLKAGSTVNTDIPQATPEPTDSIEVTPIANEGSSNQLVGSDAIEPSFTPSLPTSN